MKGISLLIFLVCLFVNSYGQMFTDWISLGLDEPFNVTTRTVSVVSEDIVWGEQEGTGYFRTTDGGQSFETGNISLIANSFIFDIFALDENTAFAAITTTTGEPIEGIYRTTNGGQDWDLVFSNEVNNVTMIKVLFFDELNGVAWGFQSEPGFAAVFYYTEDGGDSWTRSASEFPISSIWTEGGNDGVARVGDILWVSNVDNKIFKSTDNGKNWTAQSTPLDPSSVILDIAFKNELEGIAISSANWFGENTPNSLIRTIDGGENWMEIPIPNDVDANNLEFIPGTDGSFIITAGTLVSLEFMYTLDDGDTWQLAEAPSSLHCVNFISPSIGYGGTRTQNGGLLKYNDELFSPSNSNFTILPNYQMDVFPNPVTNYLTLEIENDWSGTLNLQISDILGRVVHTQEMNKDLDRTGWTIDVSGFETGMYQLMLSNGSEILTNTFSKIAD